MKSLVYMDAKIKIGVYRILRKMGLPRKEIHLDLAIREEYFNSEVDWSCFLFFLESKFDLVIRVFEEKELETIYGVINFIKGKKKHPFSTKKQFALANSL